MRFRFLSCSPVGKLSLLFKILASLLALFAYCEFGIYYVVISQCSWPKDDFKTSSDGTLRAMFLADTHLLGPFRGHWFDKLRREWQMHRAFQTAVTLFSPEVVFFLGDVFDEGMWVGIADFEKYVSRFHSLFSVPANTKVDVIVGNHDIGFHYVITPELDRRFKKAFNTSSIKTVRLKGITFILVNSMAMEQDGCFLCQPALQRLQQISERLHCDKYVNTPGSCNLPNYTPREYSRPILLQHFPLYRASDESCTGPDAAPDHEKDAKFKEKWDCLSKSSTKFLLEATNPRLVMSGHTHHGCLFYHESKESSEAIPEYSVPSFSWRNRNNPSFYLGMFTKWDYRLAKCAMPEESTVTRLYMFGIPLILGWFLIRRFLSTCQVVLRYCRRIIGR